MSRSSWWSLILAAPLALMVVPVARAAVPPPGYHVVARWKIGGEGGWDYLTADSVARRLYLSHGSRVEVVDLDRGTVVGSIAPTPGVHGIALAPELGRGYVSCGRDSSVVVFNTKTLAVVGRVALPARNPDAILYEPASRRVLVFNGGSANACVLDAARNRLLDTLALGGKPEFAVADGRGRVYVNIETTSELVELDPAKPAVLRRWSLAPGEEPSGLAMDRAHRRLFSACGNRTLVVSDADGGRVVATAAIGQGVDGVVFDPRRAVAVTSNGEGTVTVVHEDSPAIFRVAETDSTSRGARTLTFDGRTGRIFTVSAQFGPPPPATPERPRPRPTILPDTFEVIVLEP
jgi:DNA-binding beta-propeller fold protein YncE